MGEFHDLIGGVYGFQKNGRGEQTYGITVYVQNPPVFTHTPAITNDRSFGERRSERKRVNQLKYQECKRVCC